MNKDQQHIDDFFRNKLEDFSLPATDADFDAIRAGLNKKSGQKPKWFLLWVLLLLLPIAAWWQNHVRNQERHQSAAVTTSPAPEQNLRDGNPIRTKTATGSTEALSSDPKTSSTALLSNRAGLMKREKPKSGIPVTRMETTEPDPAHAKREHKLLNELSARPFGGYFNANLHRARLLMEAEPPEWLLRNWNELPVNRGFRPSLEWINGINLASQVVHSSGEVHPQYLQWKENEHTGPGLYTGLNFHLSNPQHGFSSGLHYAVHSFSNKQFSALIYDSIPFRNPDGDTIAWIRKNYRDSLYSQARELAFRSLIIPIQYNRRFTLGSAWYLEGKAGMSATLYVRNTGISIDPQGMAREAEDLNFRKSQMNYLLGIGTGYRISSSLVFGAYWYHSGPLGSGSKSVPVDIRLRNTQYLISLRYAW